MNQIKQLLIANAALQILEAEKRGPVVLGIDPVTRSRIRGLANQPTNKRATVKAARKAAQRNRK